MLGSSFDEVLVINPSALRPSSPEAISAAELLLGVELPADYVAFVQQLGEGSLGHLVRVNPAATLAARTVEWRERINKFWFWDTTEAGVTAEALQTRGVALADTFDGDNLCFDPADPERMFVLPRHDDVARQVGPGFLAAVDWMVSGELNSWTEGWTFEARAPRSETHEMIRGRWLAGATAAITALGAHSHVVEFESRTTFFLPAIGGRLSLSEEEDDDGMLWADLTHDEDANPEAVARVLVALRGE